MGRESFPTGGGHRQWGDAGQIYNTQLGAASPWKIFGLSLYAQCRRVKSNMGADTEEATRRREAMRAREVWLIAS